MLFIRYKTRCSSGALKWENCLGQENRLYESWFESYQRNGRPVTGSSSTSAATNSPRRRQRNTNKTPNNQLDTNAEDYWEDDGLLYASPTGYRFQMKFQLGALDAHHVPYGSAVQNVEIGDWVVVKQILFTPVGVQKNEQRRSYYRKGKVIHQRFDGSILRYLQVTCNYTMLLYVI